MAELQKYEKDAYSVREVQQITGYSRATIYRGVEAKEIPAITVLKAIRIPGYWLRKHLSPPQCT
jgi:transposase